MRFFHGSPRYSVDLDLDAPDFSMQALLAGAEEAIQAASKALQQRKLGLVEKFSFPKKGENVLRTSIEITGPENEEIRTQVEFSRRKMKLTQNLIAKAPAAESRAPAALPAFLLSTYDRPGLMALKVLALADRNRNQIRDVYDMALFLPADRPESLLKVLAISGDVLRDAAGWVGGRDTSYKEYLEHIDPYLGGGSMNPQSWDDLRQSVARTLSSWADDV